MKATVIALAGRLIGVLASLVSLLPNRVLARIIEDVVVQKTSSMPPSAALRFLFRLDLALYRMEGRNAIKYGKGVHTKHRHTRYHDFFVQRISTNDNVLDVGCGKGELAYDIALNAGARVVGIDLSPSNIAMARENYDHPHIQFKAGDVLKNPPTGDFNVIVLSNVLEHLTDRPVFLGRLSSLIKPQRILIRVPLFERDWRIPLRQELGVEWRLDATHEIEYTLESFAAEIHESGLRVTTQQVRWGEIWAESVAN